MGDAGKPEARGESATLLGPPLPHSRRVGRERLESYSTSRDRMCRDRMEHVGPHVENLLSRRLQGAEIRPESSPVRIVILVTKSLF